MDLSESLTMRPYPVCGDLSLTDLRLAPHLRLTSEEIRTRFHPRWAAWFGSSKRNVAYHFQWRNWRRLASYAICRFGREDDGRRREPNGKFA